MANATATEVRAKHNHFAATGRYDDHTGLSCFSPVLNIMRHPLWGRNQVPGWAEGVMSSGEGGGRRIWAPTELGVRVGRLGKGPQGETRRGQR